MSYASYDMKCHIITNDAYINKYFQAQPRNSSYYHCGKTSKQLAFGMQAYCKLTITKKKKMCNRVTTSDCNIQANLGSGTEILMKLIAVSIYLSFDNHFVNERVADGSSMTRFPLVRAKKYMQSNLGHYQTH
jgi:hypothetical protein